MSRHQTFVTPIAFGIALFVSACSGTRTDDVIPDPSRRTGFQPFSAHYRGVTAGRLEQRFDHGSSATDFGMRFYVTATVDSGASGGMAATIVLDSLADPRGSTSRNWERAAATAAGTVFGARLLPTGTLTELSGVDSATGLAKDIGIRFVTEFFPRIPAGGVEVGATWEDTSASFGRISGVDAETRSISRHRAVGWSMFEGESALEIETSSVYDLEGGGTVSGQSFVLVGQGRRHVRQYLSAAGTYLGLIAADTLDGQVELLGAGISYPLQQVSADTLSIVP